MIVLNHRSSRLPTKVKSIDEVAHVRRPKLAAVTPVPHLLGERLVGKNDAEHVELLGSVRIDDGMNVLRLHEKRVALRTRDWLVALIQVQIRPSRKHDEQLVGLVMQVPWYHALWIQDLDAARERGAIPERVEDRSYPVVHARQLKRQQLGRPPQPGAQQAAFRFLLLELDLRRNVHGVPPVHRRRRSPVIHRPGLASPSGPLGGNHTLVRRK
mmetsp:Transcript_12615/g.35201  ORF Transcript_12615/g.35201 Transcript_12615/m.35201 type:complete len:213 (-) Transcript_12615:48-686(-)